MPELPEVETTRRGLSPHLEGATISGMAIRCARLRWPIPEDMPLPGQTVLALTRRAKYLLLSCGNGHGEINETRHVRFPHPNPLPEGEGTNELLRDFHISGTLILHLGMSGSLRILPADTPAEKHEHFDLVLDNGLLMRLRDPRRFGAVLWHAGDINTHPLLARLGPEPLEDGFDARYLYRVTRGRNVAVKQFIMDSQVVVGVGNIYASEALFSAGISPQQIAGKLSLARCIKLVAAIRATLNAAIIAGGSTLRDFVNSSGNPGYFQQQHWVYGRAGAPCRRCDAPIRQIKQGQRSSFYCIHCQK